MAPAHVNGWDTWEPVSQRRPWTNGSLLTNPDLPPLCMNPKHQELTKQAGGYCKPT